VTLPHGAIPLTPERHRELAVQWQRDARAVYESPLWREASPAFYYNARQAFERWMEASR
jgi:hypothetical protein